MILNKDRVNIEIPKAIKFYFLAPKSKELISFIGCVVKCIMFMIVVVFITTLFVRFYVKIVILLTFGKHLLVAAFH